VAEGEKFFVLFVYSANGMGVKVQEVWETVGSDKMTKTETNDPAILSTVGLTIADAKAALNQAGYHSTSFWSGNGTTTHFFRPRKNEVGE
jgi:hypothetical protein